MKPFFLTLVAVAAIFSGASTASAQATGKALQIDYPSNHTSTSIRIGGTTKSPGTTPEFIRFKNEIHRIGMDTSFSEVLNTTAKQTMLSLDLSIKMAIRDNKGRTGGFVLAIIDLIDASNGLTLERITNISGTLKGDNSDTSLTRKIDLDLSKYYRQQVSIMIRSVAAGPLPILSFVDYPFNETTRNSDQIH
jgi:Leucine-rich repeat (LRR) protein